MTTRTQRGRPRSAERVSSRRRGDQHNDRWPESHYQILRSQHDEDDYRRFSRYDDQEDDEAFYDRLRSRQSYDNENDRDDGSYITRHYGRRPFNDYDRRDDYNRLQYDRGNLERGDYNMNRHWDQRRQSRGAYGDSYSQYDRGPRAQPFGYYGGHSQRDYDRGRMLRYDEPRDYSREYHRYQDDRSPYDDRYGYSDSDSRGNYSPRERRSGHSGDISRRGFAAMPRSEVRRIAAIGGRASHRGSSGRAGTRSRSSRNRSRSSANRGRR